MLWAGILAVPLAWSADLVASYALVKWTCSVQRTAVLHLVSVATLAVVGLRSDVRDVLVTHVLDAEPDHRIEFPEPSTWPFWTSLATTGLFIGSIFTPWAVVYGAVPLFITMTGWFWPKSATEGGTQPWPIRHRTLPLPDEAPSPGGAI